MAIRYSDEIIPSTRFAIVDSNNVRGGFYYADNYEELIDPENNDLFKVGLLAYLNNDYIVSNRVIYEKNNYFKCNGFSDGHFTWELFEFTFKVPTNNLFVDIDTEGKHYITWGEKINLSCKVIDIIGNDFTSKVVPGSWDIIRNDNTSDSDIYWNEHYVQSTDFKNTGKIKLYFGAYNENEEIQNDFGSNTFEKAEFKVTATILDNDASYEIIGKLTF